MCSVCVCVFRNPCTAALIVYVNIKQAELNFKDKIKFILKVLLNYVLFSNSTKTTAFANENNMIKYISFFFKKT